MKNINGLPRENIGFTWIPGYERRKDSRDKEGIGQHKRSEQIPFPLGKVEANIFYRKKTRNISVTFTEFEIGTEDCESNFPSTCEKILFRS